MAAFNKVNQFVEDLSHGVHDAATDQFTVALSASANAPVAADKTLSDLVEIPYTNLSSRNLTTVTSSQTGGIYTQLFSDLTLTASGGPVATFRYLTTYNNTPTSPLDPLQNWYDFGSDLTLADGETLLIDFTTSTWIIG